MSIKKQTICLLVTLIILLVEANGLRAAPHHFLSTSPKSAREARLNITIDKALQPILKQLPELEDGAPRLLSSLAGENGDQMDFVEDELIVYATDTQQLKALIERWSGKIVTKLDEVPQTKEGSPYLIRINPELANFEELETLLRKMRPHASGQYRVSSERGRGLLAAMAEEQVKGDLGAAVNWVSYRDTVTAISLKEYGILSDLISFDCGHLLRENLRLIRTMMQGGPGGQLAEQQLLEQIGNPNDCRPPVPEYDLSLTEPLVLPAVEGGKPIKQLNLNPPAIVPQGFTAEIISAQGSFSPQPPSGGTLYGGSVEIRSDGKQLSLATQPNFDLPDCARTETFVIRLTQGAASFDFTVVLPVQLNIAGSHDYTLRPGQNVNLTVCAAGDRGAMNWAWIPISGDAFPPPGLTFQEDADGNATLTGVPQTNAYLAQGHLQVLQGNQTDSARASVRIDVDFHESLTPCASLIELAPGEAFRCELPRPIGFNAYTWTLDSGALPPGIHLVQPTGFRWYLEGTVPHSTTVGSPLGGYSVAFALSVPGAANLATRQLTFDLGLPFSMFVQNIFLRPNAVTANTGADNTERTDLLINHIRAYDYDIVALQEVFDDDQRDQLATSRLIGDYSLVWGPTEEASPAQTLGIGEESGLGLLVKGDPSVSLLNRMLQLSQNNYTEIFNQCAGMYQDCLAKKGFSVTRIDLGPNEYIYVVNTHLQAAYDFPNQYNAIRLGQIDQILTHLSAPEFMTHPVLLLGDLNIVAGEAEYNDRLGDRFTDWDTPIGNAYSDARLPYTINKMTNPYSFFWASQDLTPTWLEQYAQDVSPADCQAVAIGLGVSTTPCTRPTNHAEMRHRLDYILIRQGSDYQLVMDHIQLRDTSPITDKCRQDFAISSYPGMACYLSDHNGLAADMRLVR